ncbi:MAG: methyl-accepting chemotaxis protein [Clostridiaceae bacterium]|nr:methyl-accepting chemotaxis protein [Clostridiaceae bacterium]
MKNSLKRKIVGLIVVLLVAAVSIVTFSNYYFTLNLQEQNIKDEHMFYANTIVDNVTGFIEKAYVITDNIQSSRDIYEFEPDNQRGFLEDTIKKYPFFDLFFIQGTDGMQTARSSGENGDRSTRWWFIKAMEERQPFVSKSYYSITGNMPVTSVIIPIHNQESELVGIMGSDILLGEVQNIIDAYSSQDRYSLVIDGEGTIVAHPDRSYVSELYNLKTYEKTVLVYDNNNNPVLDENGSHITEVVTIDLEPEYRELAEQALKGEVGTTSFEDKNGDELVVAYSSIQLPGASDNWGVIAIQNRNAALSNFIEASYRSMVVALVMLIVAILCGLSMSNKITKPLVSLRKIVSEGAEGNFNVRSDIASKDEIGELSHMINTMFQQVGFLIKNIADTSQQVAASSEELTATSQQSATAADEVARTIEEIAKGANDQAKDTEKGVEHITALGELIEKEQQYIKQLNSSTNDVTILKDEGFEIVKDLVEKTNMNNKSSKEVQEIIVNTNESAEKIENASQMIKNIAEQTNLLALNAAIEAARAGEAGRGFAVVAEEIRKLAEQSNEFTEEIAGIIKELTDKTGHAVHTMQEVGKIVASQTKSVELTNEKFEGIDNAIEKMKEVITSINESGRGMEGKRDEIIGIIENLSAISQENAAGTEEASASVEEQTASMEEIANASDALARLAEEMQGSIAKFKY